MGKNSSAQIEFFRTKYKVIFSHNGEKCDQFSINYGWIINYMYEFLLNCVVVLFEADRKRGREITCMKIKWRIFTHLVLSQHCEATNSNTCRGFNTGHRIVAQVERRRNIVEKRTSFLETIHPTFLFSFLLWYILLSGLSYCWQFISVLSVKRDLIPYVVLTMWFTVLPRCSTLMWILVHRQVY